MKILTVIGARPQFIKASVVSRAIANTSGLIEVLIHTGQHFDNNMSDVFFKELGINKPDYFLNVHGGTHGAMTGRMLESVENVMLNVKPDIILLYGDTNSTLAGALAGAKLNIPIAHVEAGLRSGNMAMPEEINRILTDRISRWLFTPTKVATHNLMKEGFAADKILQVGDVMYDLALFQGSRVKPDTGLMSILGLTNKNYVLATIHRQENTNHIQRLITIVEALILTARSIPVVWPLHPRTRAVLKEIGLIENIGKHIKLIGPVGYLDMVQLEKYAALIATDSGGVQKEAFFHQVPCVTLRDETEWLELIETGWNRLAPPIDAATLAGAFNKALGSRGHDVKPYGFGDSARKLVDNLASYR
jgi:UDP-GlcNAc3NAcA epimerase